MIAFLAAFLRELFDSILARYGDRIGKRTADDAKRPTLDLRGIRRRVRERLQSNRPS